MEHSIRNQFYLQAQCFSPSFVDQPELEEGNKSAIIPNRTTTKQIRSYNASIGLTNAEYVVKVLK
jgi:hypothetical protein